MESRRSGLLGTDLELGPGGVQGGEEAPEICLDNFPLNCHKMTVSLNRSEPKNPY